MSDPAVARALAEEFRQLLAASNPDSINVGREIVPCLADRQLGNIAKREEAPDTTIMRFPYLLFCAGSLRESIRTSR